MSKTLKFYKHKKKSFFEIVIMCEEIWLNSLFYIERKREMTHGFHGTTSLLWFSESENWTSSSLMVNYFYPSNDNLWIINVNSQCVSCELYLFITDFDFGSTINNNSINKYN